MFKVLKHQTDQGSSPKIYSVRHIADGNVPGKAKHGKKNRSEVGNNGFTNHLNMKNEIMKKTLSEYKKFEPMDVGSPSDKNEKNTQNSHERGRDIDDFI